MKTKSKLFAALKTWLVIYPSITLFLFLFGEVLSPLPLLVRTFILTAILVPWMGFVGMPVLDVIFHKISAKKENNKG